MKLKLGLNVGAGGCLQVLFIRIWIWVEGYGQMFGGGGVNMWGAQIYIKKLFFLKWKITNSCGGGLSTLNSMGLGGRGVQKYHCCKHEKLT